MTQESKKIGYYTLGCKLNYAETESIADNLHALGFNRVEFSEYADYYIINTCTVTEAAHKKGRNIIRKSLNKNPEAKVIVIGCYAQVNPTELIAIPGVAMVLGAKDKFKIAEKIQELEDLGGNAMTFSCEISEVTEFESSYSLSGRTRSFLKVQDGCNYKCSYCAIPQARGVSRNAGIATIVSQAQEIANSGVQEIVLTGINIGDFGKSTGESFLELITQLDKVEGIQRYRISSIEPNLLTREIIEFVAQSRAFMPHFHIPLQSGSDEVLALMKRRYTTTFFKDKIFEILSITPHAGIGVDVIVGMNGETPEHFEQTKLFVESLPVSYLHVFSYSERKNTDAINLRPIVSDAERSNRSLILHDVSDMLHAQFCKKFIGTQANVLIDSKQKNGAFAGYTDNYIRVASMREGVTKNAIVTVCLQEDAEGVIGV